ncbi:MAG TPA: alpha/beta fold hydrolase [Vicinamibacterales bacterium]|nr:alpha/beta fold hydrolase [Vicinamibacterales bacterium]
MADIVREVPGPEGVLEALLDEPVSLMDGGPPRAAVVLGHPHPLYGGTMHTKGLYQAAKGLSRIGCAVLRFNFRGVGRSAGSFDNGPGEMADFRAALTFMAARYPGVPLWAGGFSFGSWVGLVTGAEDDRVSTLIGIAPPIEKYDFTPLKESRKPKFFIQGELDEICPTRVLRQFYAQLFEPKELAIIDGANHLFDGQASEVGDAIEELLSDYPEQAAGGAA